MPSGVRQGTTELELTGREPWCDTCWVKVGEEVPFIPAEVADMSLPEAALTYAEGGWYVLPVSLRNAKHAGSLLGKGWPDKTSRDPDLIRRWFAEADARGIQSGIALHVGRSGALCFDVDHSEHMPDVLVRAIVGHNPPWQSTRGDQSTRGHYLFTQPEGVMLGNGLGCLRTEPGWGEVRGRNGIIVVSPTPHAKAGQGGRYEWQSAGVPPLLPKTLGAALVGSPRSRTPNPRACSPLYTKGRVRGLLDKLGSAVEGDRNKLLFWTSCRFGEMVAQGFLDEATAYDLLTRTGSHTGLPASEVAGTSVSGMRTGSWAAS